MSYPILKKEFRYRAGGLLALPVLAVAGLWGVHQLAKTQEAGNYESILNQGFAGVVTLICAVAGFAVGLWQVLLEIRVGPWAFWSHRPVSIRRLFFGKLLAALGIYLLAVGLPMSAVIWWASRPGNFFGPWLWQFSLAPLVDLLCGTVYILAGMLVGLREARWFGSRLLPMGLAVCCSGMTFAPYLWLALGAIALGWLILLPAAISAMGSRGRESRQGRLGRTLNALCLIPAMVAIPLMLAAMAVELLRPQQQPWQFQRWRSLAGADVYEMGYQNHQTEYRRMVGDSGELLADAPRLGRTPEHHGGMVSLIINWQAAAYGARFDTPPYRQATSYVLESNFSPAYAGMRVISGRERWFYLCDQRYLVGYQGQEGSAPQLIGYMGAGGFAADEAAVKPFEEDEDRGRWQSGVNPIVEAGRVVGLDLERRQCFTVFTTPPGERAVTAAAFLPSEPTTSPRNSTMWAIATDKAVYVVDAHQNVVLRHAHPDVKYPVLSMGASSDFKTFGLLYSPTQYWWDPQSQIFLRVSAGGEVLSRTELPPIQQPTPQGSTYEWVMMTVAAPPVVTVASAINNEPQRTLHVSLLKSLIPSAISLAVSLTLAHWLLRRGGERRGAIKVLWLLTVLVLGLGGILLMLAMRYWPPRVRCTHCGRKSVTTAFTCQWCGGEFPAPQPGAIGIWDRADTAVAVA